MRVTPGQETVLQWKLPENVLLSKKTENPHLKPMFPVKATNNRTKNSQEVV